MALMISCERPLIDVSKLISNLSERLWFSSPKSVPLFLPLENHQFRLHIRPINNFLRLINFYYEENDGPHYTIKLCEQHTAARSSLHRADDTYSINANIITARTRHPATSSRHPAQLYSAGTCWSNFRLKLAAITWEIHVFARVITRFTCIILSHSRKIKARDTIYAKKGGARENRILNSIYTMVSRHSNEGRVNTYTS